MNAAASRMARPELAAVRECPERHNIRVRPAVLIFGCRFAQEIERLPAFRRDTSARTPDEVALP